MFDKFRQKGAERFYTTENNKARTETVEQAAAMDDKLISVWTGIPIFASLTTPRIELEERLSQDEYLRLLMNADPEKTQAVWGVFVYRELPMLQRWMLLGFVRNGDRLILLSWKETESGYEADRFVEIDPDSELYRLAAEAIDSSGPEQP